MRWVLWVVLGGAVLVTGCQNLPPPEVIVPPQPGPRPLRLNEPLDGVVGRVISVNTRLRFVVLDYSLNVLPQVGDRLEVWREGDLVGELKVTGPVRNATVVADVVAGDPQTGDQTRPIRGD